MTLFICVLFLNLNILFSSEAKSQSQSDKVQTASNKNTLQSNRKETYQKIWQELFHSQRGSNCKSDKTAAKLKKKLAKDSKKALGEKSKKGKFDWVEEWGYGKAAYFFDFIDSVLKEDVLAEFKKIYKDMFAMSNKDTPDYKDIFDITKLISKDKFSKKFASNLKKVNKNYEPKIYSISVNTVQIHKAMPLWKWEIDVGLKDYAVTFVKKYDMNGDGRLNPRELILGALELNKHMFGSGICTHCMEGVVEKIDAMFLYLDCDNDGLITSEDLWKNLPLLKRSTSKYNIFALEKKEGIRTDAINDFILKNNKMTKGALNKVEFRNGILYGIWDRQTDYYKILDDDSKSLRKLRWKTDGTLDIKAFNTLRKMKRRRNKKKGKSLV
jgi:hypothetical protein